MKFPACHALTLWPGGMHSGAGGLPYRIAVGSLVVGSTALNYPQPGAKGKEPGCRAGSSAKCWEGSRGVAPGETGHLARRPRKRKPGTLNPQPSGWQAKGFASWARLLRKSAFLPLTSLSQSPKHPGPRRRLHCAVYGPHACVFVSF